MLLRFAHNNGMTFLENLVDRDERLERLDLVGKDRLPAAKQDTSAPGPSISLTIERYTGGDIHFHTRPEGGRRLVVPCVDDTAPHMLPYNRRVYQSSRTRCQSERISILFRKEQRFAAGTYVSAQFPLSQVLVLAPSNLLSRKPPPDDHSPILVAFRILMARSASVLFDWRYSSAPQQSSVVVRLTDSWWLQSMDASGNSGEEKRQRARNSTAKPESGQRERVTEESAGRREDERRSRCSESERHVESNDVWGKLAPVSLGDA